MAIKILETKKKQSRSLHYHQNVIPFSLKALLHSAIMRTHSCNLIYKKKWEKNCCRGVTPCNGVVSCCNALRKVELNSTSCNALRNKKHCETDPVTLGNSSAICLAMTNRQIKKTHVEACASFVWVRKVFSLVFR